MSKESYINGFCKTAASMGVNPSALADFIQKRAATYTFCNPGVKIPASVFSNPTPTPTQQPKRTNQAVNRPAVIGKNPYNRTNQGVSNQQFRRSATTGNNGYQRSNTLSYTGSNPQTARRMNGSNNTLAYTGSNPQTARRMNGSNNTLSYTGSNPQTARRMNGSNNTLSYTGSNPQTARRMNGSNSWL